MNVAAELAQLRETLKMVHAAMPDLISSLDQSWDRSGAAKARAIDAAVSSALAGTFPSPSPVAVDSVIATVSFHTGIPRRVVIGKDRSAAAVRARWAVMWTARRVLDLSYPRIGQVLGDRDHSTAMHGVDRADKLIESDPAFRKLIDRVTSAMGQPQ